MTNRQHWISKADLATTRWHSVGDAPLSPGEVRLAIDAFALTANNVTYAAFGGEPMHYWAFFPTTDPAWGRVPVWGFATVTESQADGITQGQRVYGYFPMSDTLTVEATRISPAGFMDGAAHRQGLAPIYNTYSFTTADPAYDPAHEGEQMLFRPLYATGWWLADTLTDAMADAGATPPRAVAMSSASSKTALAMAHALKSRGDQTLIGLTSTGNKAYCQGTGLFDTVLTYGELDALSATDGPSAYVDFRGSPQLTADVHRALGPGLIKSLIVGATDWSGDKTPVPAEGPTPDFFFVPDVATARVSAVGPEIMARMTADLRAFYAASASLCRPLTAAGPDAIDTAWTAATQGNLPPNEGKILSLG